MVNEYRAASHLPPVVENAELSAGARKHAEYMARAGVLGHSEDPSNPYYTPEGHQAATQSNAAAGGRDASDRFFIEQWLAAPFHGVGILDPRLTTVGYGAFRDSSTPFSSAAALNVIAGLNGAPSNEVVFFPGDGSTIGIRYFYGEIPSPFTSCPGYNHPAGLPLIVQLPTGTEHASGASLSRDGQALELCRFDGHTYVNPDPSSQHLGRSILLSRNATVLFPRASLEPGTYTASVTTNQRTITWSFSVR